MKNMHFVKAHGLGNDFILTEARDLGDLPALARRLCDRRTGVGADGLVLVCPSEKADLRMRVVNSDGSEAEMCGNAIRCFAKYARERGLAPADTVRVETLAGVLEARCLREAGDIAAVEVCMGAPHFAGEEAQTLRVLDRTFTYWPLLMGVPHAVVLAEDPTEADLMRYGAAMEWAEPFPAGTNVDFIRVQDRQNILMRVWERGCGETWCCGTGATAAAAAAYRAGLVDPQTRVHLRLGALTITCRDGLAYMRGPAQFVFEGDVEL